MSKTLILLALLFAAAQDDDNAKSRALIQGLRSENIEEREKAKKGLVDMGKAALPSLREAASDPDTEVARIVSTLIRRVEYLEQLSPRLKKWFPGVEDRLTAGGDRECAALLLEAASDAGRFPAPLTRADLSPLAAPALRAELSNEEWGRVIGTIRLVGLTSAEPELRRILQNRSPRSAVAAHTLLTLGYPVTIEEVLPLREGESAWMAVRVLEMLGGPEAKKALQDFGPESEASVRAAAAVSLYRMGETQPLIALLGEPGEPTWEALEVLQRIRAPEAGSALVKLTHARETQEKALRLLAGIRASEGLPRATILLSHPDIHVRDAAAQVLLAVGGEKEARLIPAMLADSYIPVQLAGMKAAVAWNVRSSIPLLRKLLAHKHSSVQAGAIEALGELKALEAAGDLLPFFRLKDPSSVKAAAVKALGTMGAQEAVPAIAGIMIDDGSWSVPWSVVSEALRNLTAHEQIDAVTLRLKDPSPLVRWSILKVISEFRWTRSAPKVAPLLQHPDPHVQIQAVQTLQSLGAAGYGDDVEKLLGAEDVKVVHGACAYLRSMDPKRAEPHMRRLLTHENRWIRNEAVFFLARRLDPQGLEALEKLAADPGDYAGNVREVILQLPAEIRPRIITHFLKNLRAVHYAEGLLSAANPEFQNRVASKLEEGHPGTRAESIQLVLSMGRPRDVERVRLMLEDADPGIRAAALSNLAARSDPGIERHVRERLFDVHPYVRRAAVWACQQLKLRDAVPDLELRLDNELDWMQVSVLHVLGELGNRSSVPRILGYLKAEDPYRQGIRSAALYALERIGDPSVQPAVARLLEDPEPGMRSAAARVLCKLGGKEHAGRTEALLRDPDRHVRSSVIELYARLKGNDAIPALKPLLADPEAGIRNLAACTLLRLGSDLGLPQVMHRSEYGDVSWNLLNGVRCPEAFSRLSSATFDKTLRSTLREVLAERVIPLGYSVDDSQVQGPEWDRHLARGVGGDPEPPCNSIMNLLENSLYWPYQFILERDRIRVLTLDQAREFWKAWWTDRQKK